MFIDASAIVAILNKEPGFEDLVRRIEDAQGPRFVSPLVRFEAVAAIARSRSGRTSTPDAAQVDLAEQAVARFCEILSVRDITITPAIGAKALNAARRFGKLVGHPAGLNFGDCFAYACAEAYSTRLVYKGNDFAQTDLA
jgi:ribonuclease VapC